MQNIAGPASLDLAAQLQHLGKVRESLYSQNGWSSSNVNQTSKWDVGETIDARDLLGIGQTYNRKNCDQGTNIWSSEYQAQKAMFPFANCSAQTGTSHWELPTGTSHWELPSGACYSGTGPMPKPLEFLYDDDELAKRSGVESILAESEPVIESTRHNNWSGVDRRINSHIGDYNADNSNAQYMNARQMNLSYPNYNAQNTQYAGYNSNETPIHLQLQGLNLNHNSNAQLSDPAMNPIAAIHPTNPRYF